jgi:hypothetical protein
VVQMGHLIASNNDWLYLSWAFLTSFLLEHCYLFFVFLELIMTSTKLQFPNS